MFGYIYITFNMKNNKFYIGKHEKEYYDENYCGSGKTLKKAIKKYGKENFKNIMIDCALTKEELNKKEKEYIRFYTQKYGRKCYNIASGGDGGNVLHNLSKEEKKLFIEKMTKINRERCNTESFKQRISESTKARYSDIEERKKHSEKMRIALNRPEVKEKLSNNIKSFYQNNEEIHQFLSEFQKQRWDNMSEEQKKEIASKIRVSWTGEKKKKHSENLKECFKDEEYKRKKSEETTNRWKNDEYREKVRKSMSKSALSRPNKGAEARSSKILFTHNDKSLIFESTVKMQDYCLREYGYTLPNQAKLIKEETPYISFFDNRKHMNGIIIKKIN